jgi:hypothetical protein
LVTGVAKPLTAKLAKRPPEIAEKNLLVLSTWLRETFLSDLCG